MFKIVWFHPRLHSGGCLLPWGRGTSKLQPRTVPLVAGANVLTVMPMRLFPRCARLARAVSAAIGRFDHAPVTKAHSKRPLQLLLLLRPIRATIRSSADVCLKLLALVGYCALHVCADAQGHATGYAVGPPAAAAAAPSQTAVPARPIPTTSDARIAATIAAASMSSETVRDAGHAPA